MALFSKPNKNYDENEPLSKPGWRWWTYAKCKDVSTEERDRIFYPIKQHQKLEVTYEEAHKYCGTCIVKNSCRDSAVREERRHAYGYRGDMNHKERRLLYKEYVEKGLITNQRREGGDGIIASRREKREINEQFRPRGL